MLARGIPFSVNFHQSSRLTFLSQTDPALQTPHIAFSQQFARRTVYCVSLQPAGGGFISYNDSYIQVYK